MNSNDPIDPKQLGCLSAILRTGGFDQAASALGITQSAVSQRLRALEERIGTTLVIRSTPPQATQAGRRLVAHAQSIRALEDGLFDDLGQAGSGAVLRIAVNADSLATWVLPPLAEVENIRFEIIVDDQDHSDALLRGGEVHGAITSSPAPIQGCDMVALGALRYIPTASSSFIKKWFSDGVTKKTLAVAPALVFNEKDALQSRWMQSEDLGPLRAPSHLLPSTTGFVEAAKLGLGWGLNPLPLVKSDIADGSLIPLIENSYLDTPLYWQSSRLLAPVMTPLNTALRRAARRYLVQ